MISKAMEMALWNKFYASLPKESYLHDYLEHFDEVLSRAMLDDSTLDVARLVYLGEAAKENIEAAMKIKDRAVQALLMEQQQVILKDRQLYELNGHLEAVKRDLDSERQCLEGVEREFQQFKETIRQTLNTPEVREAVS